MESRSDPITDGVTRRELDERRGRPWPRRHSRWPLDTSCRVGGIGQFAFSDVHCHVYPLLQGTVLLVRITFVRANQIVDLLYRMIDPWTRYA